MNRDDREEHISTQLPPHLGLLMRLLAREFGERYSYTEARILFSLSQGPRRIGELAEIEGLAQPTTTLLVKRLEEKGLLRRQRQAHDQRVVLASLTPAGDIAIDDLRALAAKGVRRRRRVTRALVSWGRDPYG